MHIYIYIQYDTSMFDPLAPTLANVGAYARVQVRTGDSTLCNTDVHIDISNPDSILIMRRGEVVVGVEGVGVEEIVFEF